MFRNLKIGVRLMLSFGLILALMGIVTYFGTQGFDAMQLETEEIINQRVPQIEEVAALKFNAERVELSARDQLLSANKEELEKFVAQQLEVRASTNKIMTRLQETMKSAAGKTHIQEVLAALRSFRAAQDKLSSLVKEGKKEDGLRWLRGEQREARDGLLGALERYAKYEDALLEEALQSAHHTYSGATRTMLFGSALAVLLALLTGVWVSLSITRPLGQAVDAAHRMAQGDLTVRVESNSRDEPGVLLFAMSTLIEKLSQVVGDVRSSADTLSSASEEMAATAQSLSTASSEQAASVEETSSSVEQMTASISQNTDNSKVTDQMASNAAKEADEGGEAVRKTVEAMKQIAQKISIIDDIAYQTNLLALNAAIEAARAGEHGKGFAVVAAEVRKLAERSQIAAQEISEVAGSSVQLAERAGRLLDEIVPAIRRTSELVQELTAASQEQSSGVGQINTAMNQLSQLTQQNASSSEQLAATSEEMSGQAQQLQVAMSFFKVEGMYVDRRPPVEPRGEMRARRPTLRAVPRPSESASVAAFKADSDFPAKATGTDRNAVLFNESNFVRF